MILLYTDFSPGWIGVANCDGDSIIRHPCDEGDTEMGELLAIELASQIVSVSDEITVLTDSMPAVRLIAGRPPHPSTPAAHRERYRNLAQRLKQKPNLRVAWIPRQINKAHSVVSDAP